MSTSSNKHDKRRAQSGLSLIELLVAVAMGSFILLGLTTLASSSSRNEAELARSARQLDSARYSLQIMGDDIKMAGFFGAQFFIDDPVAAATTLCSAASAAVLERDMSLPVVGLNDTAAATTFCGVAAASIADGSDVIAVRRASSFGRTGADLVADGGDDATWYIQNHPVQDPVIAVGDANANNATVFNNIATMDLAPATLTVPPVRRYLSHVYYVQTGAACGATGTPPQLRRITLQDDGTYSSDPDDHETIAEGVENMQIVYGRDTDDDGAANVYGFPADEDEWAEVVTVRIFLLMRNVDTSLGHTDTKTFDLGGTALGPYNDACKRNVYTTTINVVNQSNRRGTLEGA